MYDRLRCETTAISTLLTAATVAAEEVGELIQVEDTIGMAFNAEYADGDAIDSGDPIVLIYRAEKIVVDKSVGTGLTIAVGEKVYWNPTTHVVSKTKASGDICIGICLVAATATDTEVEIELDGMAMTDQP